MDSTCYAGHEQATVWNGRAGHAWVETQELLEQLFKPFEDLLVKTGRARNRVLDVGCGTGCTTLAAARLLGPHGHCVGIDISEAMITAARARAEREGSPASFLCADAESYSFEPGRFDFIMSRFGVMFFEDPVRAFENFRHAAAEGAELRFATWRSADENPFMTTAERAAAPLLPDLPRRRPDAPGQFAFADERRVETILKESGWAGIDIRPIDIDCTLREKDLIHYLSRLGPVGLVLQEADERTRVEVVGTVRAAFEPYVDGEEVRFTAACWMVNARAAMPM
jgi:SAM-dependent methyltransferase